MSRERLIIFTRYPEPGKAKTRLIPVLGAEGAANLHRQMTEYTISQVRQLQTEHFVSIEVYFTGSDRAAFQNWLGSDLIYHSQGEGDLGSRMAQAFEAAFTSGIDSAIIIGTDCPSLNSELIAEAFQKLDQNDLVLGPATDGGYYLIGLRRLIPELFVGINWGTSEVFQKTVEIANNLKLAVAYLTFLSDIDRPEDLAKLGNG
ncbi:TIGR04282 family arsenosugar biosynthesis glycosyltransferase [Microseira wollei]|uniref:Glycosyltransferase n=1 Tax=Microseira wollei NIES-4236 TaxID=2530354 RepID=A0AAV3X5K5_9CYAN|nr:TIGR04282 family arsenosugar biosynthesis glycosyltransferase [Microseira wollei]GET37568.1 hypothetical protein MiSe_23220 [Microseira wollei NIES-4236]